MTNSLTYGTNGVPALDPLRTPTSTGSTAPVSASATAALTATTAPDSYNAAPIRSTAQLMTSFVQSNRPATGDGAQFPPSAAETAAQLSPLFASGGSLTLGSISGLISDPQTNPVVRSGLRELEKHPDWLAKLDEGTGGTDAGDHVITAQKFQHFQTHAADSTYLPQPNFTPGREQADGDCYYMASLNALTRTPEGTQALGSHVKAIADENGHHYAVTFPGDAEKKSYSVSPQELTNLGQNYSTGDLMTQIYEVAADKFRRAHGGKALAEGGGPDAATTLLTGRGTNVVFAPNKPGADDRSQNFQNDVRQAAQNPGSAATVGITRPDGVLHIVAPIAYDDATSTVTYRDSFYPDQPVSMPYAEFEKAANFICTSPPTSNPATVSEL